MPEKNHFRIASKGRVLTAWTEKTERGIEYFVRESLERGKDVQTVALSKPELLKILALSEKNDEELGQRLSRGI